MKTYKNYFDIQQLYTTLKPFNIFAMCELPLVINEQIF